VLRAIGLSVAELALVVSLIERSLTFKTTRNIKVPWLPTKTPNV
jgi:hypothetical protein